MAWTKTTGVSWCSGTDLELGFDVFGAGFDTGGGAHRGDTHCPYLPNGTTHDEQVCFPYLPNDEQVATCGAVRGRARPCAGGALVARWGGAGSAGGVRRVLVVLIWLRDARGWLSRSRSAGPCAVYSDGVRWWCAGGALVAR